MRSAFGIEHGEVSKMTYSPEQQQMRTRGKRRAQGLWTTGAVGAGAALLARKPRLATGIAGATPFAVGGSAVHEVRELNRSSRQQRMAQNRRVG